MLVKLTPDGSDEDEAKCKVCPRDFGFPDKKLKIATFTCQQLETGFALRYHAMAMMIFA